MQIILLIAGAALGAVFAEFPRMIRALKKWKNQKSSRRRAEMTLDGSLDRYLIQYYGALGIEPYVASIHDETRSLAIFVPEVLSFKKEVYMDEEWLILEKEERVEPYPIRARSIRKRQRMGARIYPSRHDCLTYEEVRYAQEPRIYARPCNFMHIASSVIPLEDETFFAASHAITRRWRKSRTARVRGDWLPRELGPGQKSKQAFQLGGAFVFAIKTESSYEVAIHRRSAKVATDPGKRAVIPVCGFESNRIGNIKSSMGVIFYNFLREYLEEMHDYEDLIGEMAQRRLDPDWFAELDEAKKIISLYGAGEFSLMYLGTCIDWFSGTMGVCVVATLENTAEGRQIKRNLRANWEIAEARGADPAIEFVDISDPRLAQWHHEGAFSTISNYSLSIALDYLESRA